MATTKFRQKVTGKKIINKKEVFDVLRDDEMQEEMVMVMNVILSQYRRAKYEMKKDYFDFTRESWNMVCDRVIGKIDKKFINR